VGRAWSPSGLSVGIQGSKRKEPET
jgi:hypothetical protein